MSNIRRFVVGTTDVLSPARLGKVTGLDVRNAQQLTVYRLDRIEQALLRRQRSVRRERLPPAALTTRRASRHPGDTADATRASRLARGCPPAILGAWRVFEKVSISRVLYLKPGHRHGLLYRTLVWTW
ncbi:hypothetical protein BKA00_001258 [Actinomadura coerulea]|uniref:Uncharacterized protein n=1 Tax=Actinomadura coerulea TaxID=46159 RepID=A0A7X0FV91_9ACTN|nr:hypothetical protein [Actinomadura coerulea]MBB6394344.1 hypothetical protein [Actinomadura coerulea]GGQ41154.1 hypothetical protein GCM10010187_69270 [Actinomadura coerulea]